MSAECCAPFHCLEGLCLQNSTEGSTENARPVNLLVSSIIKLVLKVYIGRQASLRLYDSGMQFYLFSATAYIHKKK